eukprot:CAMPEP_0172168050 /NCGR_PEP_ID=MMETSP1050-20130122/9916_1 /TAXON_ID=233186 /ORGANISM="Cryptomonas curvata, Strain CCAP979/52" /LENGTH=95 /DNA_ID=CAMNT_0012838917 /DNA_START=351 /DNA_END=634 /DNA_ORIENTATION=+
MGKDDQPAVASEQGRALHPQPIQRPKARPAPAAGADDRVNQAAPALLPARTPAAQEGAPAASMEGALEGAPGARPTAALQGAQQNPDRREPAAGA